MIRATKEGITDGEAVRSLDHLIQDGVVGRYDRRDFAPYAEFKKLRLEEKRASGRADSGNRSGKYNGGGMPRGRRNAVNPNPTDWRATKEE